MHHLAAHNTIKNQAMKTMSTKNKHHKGNTKLNVIKRRQQLVTQAKKKMQLSLTSAKQLSCMNKCN
jgi:hypothetical protein